MSIQQKHRLYLSEGPGEIRAVTFSDNRAVDFTVRRVGNIPSYGQTYLARAEQWSPGMNGVFVSLGEGGTAFMPISVNEGSAIKPGDLFPVSVTRSPVGEKTARVSRDILFPGPRIVLIPSKKGVHFSHRARNRAGQAAQLILHRFNQEGLDCLLIRESAINTSPENLLHEARFLTEHWRALQDEIRIKKQPGLLKFGKDIFDRAVADCLARGSVYIGSEKKFIELQAKWKQITPDLADRIELCPPTRADAVTDEVLETILNPIIPFNGIGNLVFERTQALTAIDVNGFSGNKRGVRHQLNLNLQAAPEIARQIRLRGIGGLIVIDFINMPEAGSKTMIETEMRKLFSEDSADTEILPISSLGLLQMSREKNGPSVADIYCQDSRQYYLTFDSVTYNLLRKLDRAIKDFPERKLIVHADPRYLEWLNQNGDRFESFSESFRHISEWKGDPKMHRNEVKFTIAGVTSPVLV